MAHPENMTTATVAVLPDGRMDTKNAARYAGLAVKTLAMMRCEGTGPRFVKRGRVFISAPTSTPGSMLMGV